MKGDSREAAVRWPRVCDSWSVYFSRSAKGAEELGCMNEQLSDELARSKVESEEEQTEVQRGCGVK